MIVSSPALNALVAPALPPLPPSVANTLIPLATIALSASYCSALSDNEDADKLAAKFDANIDNSSSSATNAAANTDIKCDSEVYLELVCFSMKEIFSVCRGILTNVDGSEEQFANHDAAPWKDMKPSTKPTNEILPKEVIRRWRLYLEAYETPKPRSKAWTAMQCFTWLDANPILCQLYLHHIEEPMMANEEAEIKREMLASVGATTNKPWTGLEPYLRLIECLLSNDDIRSAFLCRNSLPSNRMELEIVMLLIVLQPCMKCWLCVGMTPHLTPRHQSWECTRHLLAPSF